MRKLLLFPLLLILATAASAQPDRIADFEDFQLPLDTFLRADATHLDTTFESNRVLIPSQYDTSFGGFWSGGFAISTSRNDSVGNFTNLYGVVAGEGALNSDTYLVGQQDSYLLFDSLSVPTSLYYTLPTYTAQVLRDGSAFSRPFGVDSTGQAGVPDSLVLQVRGYYEHDLLLQRDIFLADFRGSDDDDYILDEWRREEFFTILLDSLHFTLVSSDQNMFGNNTPDFFALDHIELAQLIISTREEVQVTKVDAYPNPSAELVRLGDGAVAVQLQLLDQLGRPVREVAAYQLGQPLPVHTLASGLYTAVMRAPDATYISQFVVK